METHPSMVHERKGSTARLSQRVFVTLVENLSSDDLEALPPSRLPAAMTSEVMAAVPPHKTSIVENLLLRSLAADLGESLATLERYGDEVVAALDEAASFRMGVEIANFTDAATEYLTLHNALGELRKAVFPDSSTQQRLASLKLELGRQAKQVLEHLESIYRLRRRREQHMDILVSTGQREPTLEPRLRRAVGMLTSQVRTLDETVAPFLQARFEEAEWEMTETKERVNALQAEMARLEPEIERRVEEIAELEDKAHNRRTAQHIQELRGELATLYEEKAQKEMVVSESALLRWLDAFVEANVNQFSRREAATMAGRVKRSLFFLLSKYCETQEDGARSVANRGVVQVDAETTMAFLLDAERFVLDYFAQKKKEYSQGINNTARLRLAALDLLAKDLVETLQSSSQYLNQRSRRDEVPADPVPEASGGFNLFAWLRWLFERPQRQT